MDIDNEVKRSQHPRANANIFEIITFSWLSNLFKKGKKKDLELNDLYANLNEHTSTLLGNLLEEKWKQELTDAVRTNRKPSLLKTLIKTFGVKIMLLGLVSSIGDITLKISQPVMIGKLLSYFNPEGSEPTNLVHAYIYAFGLTISRLGTIVLFHGISLEMSHFGMKMRVACCAIIYRKILRLSRTATGETRTGKVLNLLSNDVNRFDSTLFLLHYLWISPVQTIVVAYFLWQEIGVSSVLGLLALITFIPLQGWLGKKSSEFRFKTSVRTDERVRLMNEIISGIQVIKMYTWEKPFAYLVKYARKMEIRQIKGSSYIKAVLVSYSAFHTRISLFFSILSYVLLGNKITAQKVFIIASYFSLIRVSMSALFPRAIAQTAEMLVTIKRIQDFLLFEEKDKIINPSNSDQTPSHEDGESIKKFDKFAPENSHNDSEALAINNSEIVITNATAKWSDGQSNNSLENINLTIRPGRLVAIIGPVGAGKSSLVQAILRELPLSQGSISVRGVISYASQEPWLFNGSVKQNILFNLPLDTERYKQVIKVCALKTDFKQLPFGDRTIVGEKGVSLSGGQRARINLARAIYKQADIYILDDPLSAVDTHVGRHLFEKCIEGFLAGKTCILVTHQVQYLNNVEHIVLMENASIVMEGTYDVVQASNFDFAKSLLSSTRISNIAQGCKNNMDYNYKNPKTMVKRQASVISVTSVNGKSKDCKDPLEPIEVEESCSTGNIPLSVYLSYFFAGGRMFKIVFFILISILTQVFISGGDLWITYWVNLEDHDLINTNSAITSSNTHSWFTYVRWPTSRESCCIIYAVLICVMILMAAIRSVTFVSVCMTASTNLHDKMFNALTRATIYFFNTNSSGRILNRFSKDIGCIDEVIPVAMMDSIHNGFTIFGIFIVIGIVNIYLMIPVVFFIYIFCKLSDVYLSTSRSIKRLEGITRSPIFTHLNTTIQGLTTIRACNAEQVVSKEFDVHQDLHSATWYLFITSSRAFGLWLDLLCLIYVTIVTFSFVAFTDNGMLGGNVGLAVTQAFGLIGMLQWGIRQAAELENNMTSVERVLEYVNAPQEAALESTLDKTIAPDWPSNGQITFENFYLRYGPDSQNVLKNLNVKIESMQKVGIVGRTGAGKSSMIAALFRLALNEGKIIIDGIDIHDLGLHKLRSTISIIPQEPILFSGKLRKNLDPFDEYSDHTLWNALDEVELKDVIEDLPQGLNTNIYEGGSNFSLGQRQLVCLARAILRNNKILVLDEATANVDPQTDALIQRTIRNKFQTSTVLTIAHRLNTIMDSDKVIVMDAGKIVEFDHPYNLLKNKDGFLSKMVEQTGKASSDLLHNITVESYSSLPNDINHIE